MSTPNATSDLAPQAIGNRLNRLPLSPLNMVLAGLLIVQVVLIAVVYWPRANQAATAGPLLPDLAASSVTAISIVNNLGGELNLERTADGWSLAGTDGFPANKEKVDDTLGKLLGITRDRLVTRTESSHAALKVADSDFERRVTLTTSGGKQTIYLGSSAGAGATHVRAGGAPETYLTGSIASWELDVLPSGWINTQYVSYPADSIVKLTLINSNGTLNFTRNEDEEWTMEGLAEGEQLNTTAVDSLVNRVATVALTRPLGQTEQVDYGLAQPQATVIVTTRDDEGTETAHTLLLGAKTEDENGYYFKASDSPYFVTIASFTGNDLTAKQRSDFVTVPTPEATTPEDGETDAESSGDFPPLLTTPEAESASPITGTTELTTTNEITVSSNEITATSEVTPAGEITTTEP